MEQLDERVVPTVTLTALSNVADTPSGFGTSGSLRYCIEFANASSDHNIIINLSPGGVYNLTRANTLLGVGSQENDNKVGDLDIQDKGHVVGTKTITIQSTGLTAVIRQTTLDRVFQILSNNLLVNFRNVSITGGIAVEDGTAVLPFTSDSKGGAILNSGGASMTFKNVTLSGNVALGGDRAPGANGFFFFHPDGFEGIDGAAAFGGAIYSTAGTISFATTQIQNNQALGGDGANGGNGANAPSNTGLDGGNGADGHRGGDGFGGAIYAETGVISFTQTSILSNSAIGGKGGNGGNGGTGDAGPSNSPGGNGGNGGNTGAGGNAGGGGVYVQSATLTFSDKSPVRANIVQGGAGGNGGAGAVGGPNSFPQNPPAPDPSPSTPAFGHGGFGGNGNNGGFAVGGGLFVESGDITINAGSPIQLNSVVGGRGGDGGNGANAADGFDATVSGMIGGTAASGGDGGNAGDGGDADGGGLYVVTGNVVLNVGAAIAVGTNAVT
ncbi:MAG TPA: hypothetical protein VLM40_16965, partial [Gemmata sp.]|nr:hypothetical protein [Gemmata sp.]